MPGDVQPMGAKYGAHRQTWGMPGERPHGLDQSQLQRYMSQRQHSMWLYGLWILNTVCVPLAGEQIEEFESRSFSIFYSSTAASPSQHSLGPHSTNQADQSSMESCAYVFSAKERKGHEGGTANSENISLLSNKSPLSTQSCWVLQTIMCTSIHHWPIRLSLDSIRLGARLPFDESQEEASNATIHS